MPAPPLNFGRQDARRARGARRGAFVLILVLASGAARAQDGERQRAFSVTPRIGLQGIVTDNAEGVEHQRKGDLILRGVVGVDANLQGRMSGELSATLSYDQYADLTELSGASVTALGSGAFELASDALWIEADGAVVNSRTTPFGAAAIDRSGVPGRTQLALYQVGPRLNVTLADVLDVAAAAKFGQVFYSEADGSVIDTPLPDDDTTLHATFRADTAGRARAYQLLTTAQLDDDDQGFRSTNLTQSLFVRLTPRVRLIGRVGYDWVRQQGIADLDEPLLTGGFEYSPNRRSKFRIEAGSRYDGPTWAAAADIGLHDRLVLTGAYTEAIEPDQILVASSFRRFLEDAQTAQTTQPVAPTPEFAPPLGVYAQTSLNKVATLAFTYRDERNLATLSSSWIDRKFLPTDTHDRTLGAVVGYERALRRDLGLMLNANYARTFESPLYGESQSYGFTGRLDYQLNSTTRVNAAYAFAYSEQRFPGGQTIYDNTIFVTLEKSF